MGTDRNGWSIRNNSTSLRFQALRVRHQLNLVGWTGQTVRASGTSMGQTWNATLIVVYWSGKLLAASFNGAITFRSWIHLPEMVRNVKVYEFQWGHNLSVMDTVFWRRFARSCAFVKRTSLPSVVDVVSGRLGRPISVGKRAAFLRAVMRETFATGALALREQPNSTRVGCLLSNSAAVAMSTLC